MKKLLTTNSGNRTMTEQDFTVHKITDLIINNNWVLQVDNIGFFLSHKDDFWSKTQSFNLTGDELNKLYNSLQEYV